MHPDIKENYKKAFAVFAGSDVQPAKVTALKGEASSRTYYRAVMPDGILPAKVVIMELPKDINKCDEISNEENFSELSFINIARHLGNMGIRIPKIYCDYSDRHIVLLEDLGDVRFFDAVKKDISQTLNWYEAAVDFLADLHQKMWPVPMGCHSESRKFNFDVLRQELNHYREWGNEKFYKTKLEKDIRDELDNAFDDFAQKLVELPLGFVHRDFQSRNLMVTKMSPKKENLVLIDFQDALTGPALYDLTALLNDSYIDLDDDIKIILIKRYAQKMNLDFTETTKQFHMLTVHRKLKDGGRFVYIDKVRGNPSFLKFVEKTFERVASSLNKLEDFSKLKTALSKADPKRF